MAALAMENVTNMFILVLHTLITILITYGKSPFLMGKSAINGTFSIAMLVYQRVRA